MARVDHSPSPPGWSDPSPPFLETAAAPWAARGLAYLLIGLAAAALVTAVILHLPETVSSPFVLIPVHGTDPIRAPRSGVVAAVEALEGQTVQARAPVFVIRSVVIGDRSAELQALETQVQGTRERLRNETRQYESQRLADTEEERRLRGRLDLLTRKIDEQRALWPVQETKYRDTLRIYENDVDITQREIEFKRQHLAVAKELADRVARAYATGVFSWLEYNNRQLEARKLAVDLQELDRQLDSARLKVSQLNADEARQKIDWTQTMDQLVSEHKEVQTSLDKLRAEVTARRTGFDELQRGLTESMDRAAIRIAALKTELAQSHGDEISVLAPCTGTVLRQQAQAPGAVVHDGDVLGEVACVGGTLQAELSVPPSGIGLIKRGQGVKLLYDSFPYQRYGVRYGTVRWVSPASVTVKDRSVFRVLVDIKDRAIIAKGESRSLSAGMSGRADVVVGRRPLITYVFEPLRQLRESLADAPADRTGNRGSAR